MLIIRERVAMACWVMPASKGLLEVNKQLSGQTCGRGRDFKWFPISAECSHKQLLSARGSHPGSMRRKGKCLPAPLRLLSSHVNATEDETRSEGVTERPWRGSSRSADGMENTGPPQRSLKGMNGYTESDGIPGAIDSLLISKEQRILILSGFLSLSS